MRKLSLISIVLLIVSIPTFAGGLLTNTNQHVLFLRMLARDASTDIDAVYSNPAGLAFRKTDFISLLMVRAHFRRERLPPHLLLLPDSAGMRQKYIKEKHQLHLFPVCLLFIRKAIGRFPEVLQ